MKAIDIATVNHISIEDMFEVCKGLGIDCEDQDTELSEKEVFLIKKRIEVIKSKKADEVIKSKKTRKIKLKRKVQKTKATDEKKPAGKKKTAKAVSKKTTSKKAVSKKIVSKKDPRKGTVKKDTRTPAKKKGAGDKEEAKDKLDTSKKRRKGKEKDSKKRYKKGWKEERSFSVKKKQQDYEQVKEVLPPSEISIIEGVTVGELARKLHVKAKEVISKLMKMGVLVTINEALDIDTVTILADEYGTAVKVVSLFDETVIKQDEEDNKEDYKSRSPIVTVMGHVDHGKTKLLDAIRATNVVDQEFGGITQHIGAYMVKVGEKKITFLDTPGHAAFTTMRARGAEVTDIVILVVAANDGIMPQTVEAINHAKDADVPIIVAINKIDLEEADPKKIRQELLNYELIPEELGGTTLICEISAKQRLNIEQLLELILMQAELLELKANSNVRAKGTVIESKLDSGRGAVSTILVQNGMLKAGDPYVVGVFSGKVRAMFDDQGVPIKKAGPSTPVEVLGISGVPAAGDPFEGVESEKFAKQISQKRLEYKRLESAKKVRKVTLESLNEMIKEGDIQELRVIVKADVDGSTQALTESLEKLSNENVRVKVIHSGTGGINESDVMLASASNAIVIGYHVRPTGKVSDLAEKENISIKFYNVIFEATEDIIAAMSGMLKPVIKEETQGTGDVLKTFKISKFGTVAGAMLNSGKVEIKSKIRIVRDGVVVYEGELKSLKRYKADTNVVEVGQEFGFGLVDFNDIKDGDGFEAFKLVEVERSI